MQTFFSVGLFLVQSFFSFEAALIVVDLDRSYFSNKVPDFGPEKTSTFNKDGLSGRDVTIVMMTQKTSVYVLEWHLKSCKLESLV